MYYVYVLYSIKFNKFYIGLTDNIKERVEEHNLPENKGWTRKYKPWMLVYYESYLTASEARLRELSLKYYGKTWTELKKRILRSLKGAAMSVGEE